MGKKKAGIILGAVLLAAAAAGGIWYFWGNGGKDSNDRVYVEKVSVVMGTATGAQNRYSGVVQPQKTVNVNADSDRTISEVLVEVGDAVEVGTPLFTYDVEEIKLELEQGKLELENQDNEISNFRSQIAELEKERNAAAEGDKFEYTTQIQTLQTQIKQAEYEKSSKQLELDKTQKKIDNAQVLSTSEGVIKSINDGQSSDEGASSAFMTILSTGEYRVQGTINEQNVGMITAGQDVIIRSRVDEEITWRGTIDTIDTGDASSSSENEGYSDDSEDSSTSSSKYPFYVTMEDASGLMLGQHVLIELDEGQTEEKEGIWLYSSYIVWDNGTNGTPEEMEEGTEFFEETEAFDFVEDTEMFQENTFVWADDGSGRLEKRAVVLGEYDEALDEYEILSGLVMDDLIAWPMEGLYEGVKTVTNMDEVDYSSDLYNQGSTEEIMEDFNMEDFDMDDVDMDSLDMDGDFDSLDMNDSDLEDYDLEDGASDDVDMDSLDMDGGAEG